MTHGAITVSLQMLTESVPLTRSGIEAIITILRRDYIMYPAVIMILRLVGL